MRTVDNQYHLQALRHLYVLAVEWRSLVTVDVSTKLSVTSHVLLSRASHQGESNALKTPCLLPELTSFDRILVDDPCYFSFKAIRRENVPPKATEARYLRDTSSVAMRDIIFVKNRNSCTSLLALEGGSISVLANYRESIFEIRCLEAIWKSPLLAVLLSNIDRTEMMRAIEDMHIESLKCKLFEYITNGSLPSDASSCKQLSLFLLRFSLLPYHQWENIDKNALRSALDVSSSVDELGVRLAVLSSLLFKSC